MNRIMIIGCSGSGKSTLARALHGITKLPLIHLDQLFWKSGWIETPDNEWEEINREIVIKPKWILDGNYGRTMDYRLEAADVVIFLDRPTLLCFYRVLKRIIRFYGQNRPDMTSGCNERMDMKFFGYVLGYNKNRRAGIVSKLSKLGAEKKVFVLKTEKEIQYFLENI